jgi:hypothetical protein
MKRIVDYDPITGISTWFDYHHETDMAVVTSMQDVDSILDRNKTLSNDESYTKKGFKNDWWHYATIPNILIEKWKLEEGIDVFNRNHDKAVWKKLNSPEYKYLKTTARYHK